MQRSATAHHEAAMKSAKDVLRTRTLPAVCHEEPSVGRNLRFTWTILLGKGYRRQAKDHRIVLRRRVQNR
jgi:hypothetical protein